MSRDFTPEQLFLVDLQGKNELRNSTITYTLQGGEEIRADNHLAKDRYPELSFLYSPFDELYKQYESDRKALELLDKIEATLKDCETELLEGAASNPFKGEYDDTVEAWFKGKLDESFYYHEENDRLFGEYLEMSIAAYIKAIQLTNTDEDYHIEADIPRTDERAYTYRIGLMRGQEMLVDMYAGKNEDGDFIIHNLDEGFAYTETDNDREYYKLSDELTCILEEKALSQLKSDIEPKHKGHGMVVILAGASGSGKDTIKNELVTQGYERLVTSTTRSPRTGEQDGVDYHFKSVKEFEDGIADGSIFEYRRYNSSDGVKYYGSQMQELDPNKDYVIVLDDTGITDYQKAYGKENTFAVLVEVPDEVRYDRAFQRQFPNAEEKGVPLPIAEAFEAEWESRLADDKARFSEEFIGKAINFRLDNEYALADVMTALHNAQNAYEAAVKSDKHYVVEENMKNGKLSYEAKPASKEHNKTVTKE